ncbi:MAG: hypothetical protein EBY81_04740 [Verrucomicrobia bacterium]|nr:hypothetical protein [Verrucomicrobiota bacterium]
MRDTLTRGFFAHAKAAKDAKGGFDLGMRNAEFGILEKRGLKSDRALRIPQLRDEVWNSFHAKDGKDGKEFQM